MAKRGNTTRKPREFQSEHLDLIDVEVDSPYGHKKKDTPKLNKKSDVVTWLYHNNHIDDAQMMAANRFMRLLHKSEAQGAQAIDYLQEPVDGGGAWPEADVHAIEAGRELWELAQFVGMFDYNLMRRIIGGGMSFSELAKMREYAKGAPKTRAEYLGSRFRDALDVAADHWGYAS